MIIIFFALIMELSIFSFFLTKKLFNPAMVYGVFWGVIILLASLRLYGMMDVADEVYGLVLLSIVCFDIGTFSTACFEVSKPNDCQLSYLKLVVLFVIGLVLAIVPAYNAIGLIRSGVSMWDIRYTQTNKVFSSGYGGYKFISLPLAAALPVLFVSSSLIKGKFDKITFFVALILGGTCFIAEGGRTIIFIWFISIAYYVFQISKKANKKIKRYLFIIIFGILFLVWLIFKIRETENIFKSIYTYFCGGIVYFSRCKDYFNQNFDRTVFYSSYQGLIRPIINIINRVGVSNPVLFDKATDFLMFCQTNPVTIFDNNDKINYFTTNFGYYYVDGGVIGVIIHSLFLGIISGLLYNKNEAKSTIRSTGMYLFVIIGICLGIMSSCFTEVTFSWGIVFFNVFLGKKRLNISVKL